jgi:hypothetical protein
VSFQQSMRRLLAYFTPHLYAVPAGLAAAFAVRWVASFSGSCKFLCYPPVTFAMGLLGGLLGAQLYRSENPLPEKADRPLQYGP